MTRVRRLAATMLCVGLTLGLTGLAGLAGPEPDRPSQPASDSSVVDEQAARMAAAQDLLSARAAAVKARDKPAWMATVDRTALAFGRRQSMAFDNILKLPMGSFSYGKVSSGAVPPGSSSSGAVTWVAPVSGSYSLVGFDRTPRSFEAAYTLVLRREGWRIADDADGSTAMQLWDLPGLRVLHSRSGMVIGNVPQERMREYGALADAAVRRVSGVWGTGWNAHVVVVTPATAQEFARLLAGPADNDLDQVALDQVAAVTRGGMEPGQLAQGDQIVINPKSLTALKPDGRRMVITHELTHVAIRSSTTRAVPPWLSEGMADYVGYSGLDLPREIVASDLLALVRAGKGSESLPTAADFDPSRTKIAPTYSGAWLAVTRLVDLFGQARVVAFYQTIAGGHEILGGLEISGGQAADRALGLEPDARTKLAFPKAFGVSQEEFVAGWKGYLQTLARKRR